jgi:S-adenosylmethionine-diacylgycerolhomoserine-N-methlytransferase
MRKIVLPSMVVSMSINAATEDLPSVDHKQRMDSMYRVQRHFYDVTRAYYLLGRNERIAALKPPAGGTVLEVGCGTGRNLIQLARHYPEATIYGVDISDEMLVTAANAVAREELQHRVKLAQGDATTFDGTAFGKTTYDRVLFSYTLSMIPDWKLALHTASQRLARAGELHVVDFGPCNGLPDMTKTLLYAWLKSFHVSPRASLFSTVEQLARSQGMSNQNSITHRGYAQHSVLCNH